MKQNQTTTTRSVTGKLAAFAAVGAYFAVLFVGGLLHGHKLPVLSPDYIVYFHPIYYAIAWICLTGILLLYGSISKPFVYGFAWIATVAYTIRTAISGQDMMLSVIMCGIVALMTVICGRALRLDPTETKVRRTDRIWAPSVRTAKMAVGALTAVAGITALILSLLIYLSYTTDPSVSTGVYAQMMHSLKNGFSFDTTLEFGETVSHLGAHISPIFLLYLPFYAWLPSPVTLLVLQTLAVYSAVVPLWLIARRRGLSTGASALLCGLLALFPAALGGTVGSFHEYALLLPLLLWLIWSLEARRKFLPWVFALLVLCVRETAAIHLFTLGIYWMLVNRRALDSANESHRRERVYGGVLAIISAIWLVVALWMLSTWGKGTLITRFDNVTGEYGTFIDSLLREIFYNPALVLSELIELPKLAFSLLLLLPIGLLPIFTKRRAGLVFLFPLLFLNLLSDFSYHYDMNYPYAFGMTAFLFYLAVLAIPELKARMDAGRTYRRVAALALCFTMIAGTTQLASYGVRVDYALGERQEIAWMEELVDLVDEDTTVSASARLCPHLANREELYTLSQKVETDIVLLDLRNEWIPLAEMGYTIEYYEEKGYEVIQIHEEIGAILRRK